MDSPEGEFVEFVRTGSYATGEFHCSSCGYGIAVSGPLPQCPMCAGTTWEPGDTSFIIGR
ncbi:MAG TPA: hypothetical protein VGH52_08570 [Gaiellaceae bacterium]